MKEYKVLSIWEPFASLLVHGVKKIETRPKPTKWTIEKGSYLIHVAKKWTKEQRDLCLTEPFYSNILKCGIKWYDYSSWHNEFKFSFGHIIGAVDVVECCPIFENLQNEIVIRRDDARFNKIEEPELSFGDYREGRYAWILANPRILETPIPYKGQQGYYAPFKGDIDQLKFI
jgi:hypothetical protein